MTDNLTQLTTMAAPIVKSLGLEIWGIEFASGPSSVLRVYVEGPDGVTIEQCAEVSRLLGLSLDMLGDEAACPSIPGSPEGESAALLPLLKGPYMLEVSSPGLERIFFSPAQLGAYVGQTLELSLKKAPAEFPRQKNFKGVLRSADIEDGGAFALLIPAEGAKGEDKTLFFAWNEVRKVRLIFAPASPTQEKGRKKPNTPKDRADKHGKQAPISSEEDA